MATLLDERLETEEEEAEISQIEAQQEPEEETPAAPVDDIPDKYKNKSTAEIVRMHQEAEKLLGRQSSEVGDLRKSVDELLKVKVNEEAISTKEEEPELDFYDNPGEAVRRAVEGSNTVKQMQELLARQQQQDVLGQIATKHPDYEGVIKDQNFIDWIKASAVRTELLQRADNYDFNAADELLSNWKEIKGVVEKTQSLGEQDRKLQVKAASTGGKGSGEPMSRKVYKRSEIVNLMINDPRKYAENVHVFDKAYAEGRVK